MKRLALALGVALFASPVSLYAQGSVFTVQAASADVYKAPTTASPVIGHAPRGAMLSVTRELGSWVKVSWPPAEDGIAYVHMSMGSLGRNQTSDASRPAVARSPQPAAEPPAATTVAIRGAVATPQPAPTRVVYLQAPAHLVGFGGRMGGSSVGFGASARAWSRDRWGIQLDVSHLAVAGVAPTERVSAMQFEPGVLFSVADHVADYLWVRPYLGSGINVSRRSLSSTTPGAAPSISQNDTALQVFGGSELTLAGAPRFAMSIDLAYRWGARELGGVDLGRLGLSVAGRWYLK
jgi:hypothetical protein